MKTNSNCFIFILLFFCCFPIFWGIFHPGFFVSDDGNWMVIRLSAFYSALASGQFPVRFLPQLNFGLGYPVADFLYPLFLYIGSLIHLVKIPFLFDIKIILAGSFFFGGWGMYLFLRKHFHTFPAFVGAVAYLYFPYHLYDLYARGSVGEVVSLCFAPFLFWALAKKSWILSSIFLCLIILAHNTLALFFLPAALLFGFVQKMQTKSLLLFLIFGLGLSCFFWFPALFNEQYTVFHAMHISKPSVYFVNVVSYQLIGWIGLALFGAVLFFKQTYTNQRVLFFFCLGLLSLFFSLQISSFFWQFPFLGRFVQFPFRFLSLTLFAESFLAAYIMSLVKNKIFPALFLLLLLLVSSSFYLFPKTYSYQSESFYATNPGTTTVKNEYMPKWVLSQPATNVFERVLVNPTDGKISDFSEKGTRLSFVISLQKKALVKIAFAYYPGWQVRIDGQNAVISPSSPDGLIQLHIPKGQHSVRAFYADTRSDLFADAISIVSLMMLIIFVVKKNYEK